MTRDGDVAQLVERLTENQGGAGSTPAVPTGALCSYGARADCKSVVPERDTPGSIPGRPTNSLTQEEPNDRRCDPRPGCPAGTVSPPGDAGSGGMAVDGCGMALGDKQNTPPFGDDTNSGAAAVYCPDAADHSIRDRGVCAAGLQISAEVAECPIFRGL